MFPVNSLRALLPPPTEEQPMEIEEQPEAMEWADCETEAVHGNQPQNWSVVSPEFHYKENTSNAVAISPFVSSNNRFPQTIQNMELEIPNQNFSFPHVGATFNPLQVQNQEWDIRTQIFAFPHHEASNNSLHAQNPEWEISSQGFTVSSGGTSYTGFPYQNLEREVPNQQFGFPQGLANSSGSMFGCFKKQFSMTSSVKTCTVPNWETNRHSTAVKATRVAQIEQRVAYYPSQENSMCCQRTLEVRDRYVVVQKKTNPNDGKNMFTWNRK